MRDSIKGILVGCDDEEIGGYEWVINNKDWDNGNYEITSKLNEYKNDKDFKIYFYVFKSKTEFPAKTSDEYRGTIFGMAEIKKIELNKNDPTYKYPHHIKLKNLELFEPQIKFEDIEIKLENYGWTEKQKSNFGVNLSHHGLLLTEQDCNLLNTYANSIKIDDKIGIGGFNMVNYWIFIARREEGDLNEMRRVIEGRVWDFISRESKPKNPQCYSEFKIGDFVLFYLAVTYPDGTSIENGRSIIGKARLGSPYLKYGKYFETDEYEEAECFVFLTEPDTKFYRSIEPKEYGIGHPGQKVVKISKKEYDSIVSF